MKKILIWGVMLCGVTAMMTSCYSTRILYGDVKEN